MQFLGMFRHARTIHAQGLTKEMFVSLGRNAVSARDVYAQGGLIVMAEGEARNRNQLTRALKLSYDASMSLITARAYRMWGADYPRRMEGNVVTAVIDRAEDRMIVSSDRAGAIGVYYAWRGRSAAFASHPELLLKMGAAGRRIERDGICELFALGGFFSPGRTAFRDIRQLEGGCVLVADSRGMRIKRYDSCIQAALKNEDVPFTLDEYVKTLPQKEYALLLSHGFSEKMAPLLRERMGAVFYHHASCDQEEIEAFSKKLDAPVEPVSASPDALIEAIHENVIATGFPGTGAREAIVSSAMKEASGVNLTPILGGEGVFALESMTDGNLLRFLKRGIYEKIDAEGYARDRLNEIIDKLRLPMDAPGGEEWAERIAVCISSAGEYVRRLRLMADHTGCNCFCPMMDERFLAKMLSGLSDNTCDRPIKRYLPAYEEAIIDEMRSILNSDDQPVFELVDPKAVLRETKMESADVSALSRLISINLFLYRYEAEISGI